MKTTREAGDEQQRVVGHGRSSPTNRPPPSKAGDWPLFPARQQSEPDEEPDRKDREADECNFLLHAGPSKRESSLRPHGLSSSAESGADHVHGDFKTKEHQIDDSDREYYLYAQHCF
jgi:hypothetical protein